MKEESFGVGSVAVPLDQRAAAEALDWMDIGLRHEHGPWTRPDAYTASDLVDLDGEGNFGVALVLAQRGNTDEPQEWHLHQDLVIALRLKREGDVWVAIDEGTAKWRGSKGRALRRLSLEIRAEYLKDYLCARSMALYVSSYRQRIAVVADASFVTWPAGKTESKRTADGKAGERKYTKGDIQLDRPLL